MARPLRRITPRRPTETKPVAFRAATALVERARRRAAREGLDWAPAMRSLLYDFAAGRNASPSIARECVRLAAQLRPIGINLNQIARALNIGTELDSPEIAALREDVARLAKVIRRVHDAILTRRPPRKPSTTPFEAP